MNDVWLRFAKPSHLRVLMPGVLIVLSASAWNATAAVNDPVILAQIQQQRIPRQMDRVVTGIQGIVRSAQDRRSGGVLVTLRSASRAGSVQVITTGGSTFRFLDLSPGDYALQVEAAGLPTVTQTVTVTLGDVTPIVVMVENTIGEPALRQVPLQPQLGLPPPIAPAATEPQSRSIPVALTPDAADLETARQGPLREDVFSSVPNRWKEDYPSYRRYPYSGEYPYVKGRWYDPFNRNKLKGDYPVIGNQTFLNLSAVSETFTEGRVLPTPTNVSTARTETPDFFGKFGQFFTTENLEFSLDLFHGDAAFRPADWRVKISADENLNYLLVGENGVVSPDPRKGTTRFDDHASLQQAFGEIKLKDLSNQFDFVSARVGIQPFTSDFRGFIFSDEEPGIRLFGNLRSNRYQYNAAYFAMLEKDTNSGLNRFEYRHQQVYVPNLYRQDFFKPGYTIQVSFHYDKDDPSVRYDQNGFLVRPAPIGSVVSGGGIRQHAIRAYYYGLTGDGHIGPLNLTHAFYQVLGHDSFNAIAGRPVDINAQMAAAELSLDRNWLRYRVSFMYASGDRNPRDGSARGFDAIFDNPNFAGGVLSFWNREGIRLTGTGVALESPDSLLPSLRSSELRRPGELRQSRVALV